MKTKSLFITAFLIAVFLSNCVDEPCDPPPCPQANINHDASLAINFCVDSIDMCFSQNDLEEIQFYELNSNTTDTVASYLITNLASNNYQIIIGGSELMNDIKFGPEPGGAGVLINVVYDFLINIPSTGTNYKISHLSFVENDECSCPNFNFESFMLNNQIVLINNNTIELTKQ